MILSLRSRCLTALAMVFVLFGLPGLVLAVPSAPALTGTVMAVDAGGAPVAGASVLARDTQTGETFRSSETDAEGAFRIDDLPLLDHRYHVSVVLQDPHETREFDHALGAAAFDVVSGGPIVGRAVFAVSADHRPQSEPERG